MSKEKEIIEQTAFGTAGIPTPPDQQDITPTDMVSDAVEDIVDNIQDALNLDSDKDHK